MKCSLLAVLALCAALATVAPLASALTVLSVDFGSEGFKVGIVKPGVPMEVVMNAQSQRKTTVAVSFRQGERLVGDPAFALTAKYPTHVYTHLQPLLGQLANSSSTELYRQRFPYHKIVANEQGLAVFKSPEQDADGKDIFYTVEELVGTLLEDAKNQAQVFSGDAIFNAVITVPAFFAQAERQAVLNAAQLVGLNVLQLMNENAAVALNYGVFRRHEFNATPQFLMFYDMGAGSTTATLARFSAVPPTSPSGKKSKSLSKEAIPVADIIGVGYDRSLGGFEFDLVLRDHLAKGFTTQYAKKISRPVTANPRAMAKLLKEANRVKEVLSANIDTVAQIESLHEDIDFKLKVTRAELETMCAHLFARVASPIEQALAMANVTLAELNQVILVGGGSRVPKVQELLMQVVQRTELGKNINADEAAVMGAAYQAAALSKAFRVKPFDVTNRVLFPVRVTFPSAAAPIAADASSQDEAIDGEATETTTTTTSGGSLVSKTLYTFQSTYPSKKVMTFARHHEDFVLDVQYGDLEGNLSADALVHFGPRELLHVAVTGLDTAVKGHEHDVAKGVKVHFEMDLNGIVRATFAEAVFQPPEFEIDEPQAEKSTFDRIGEKLSSFFGSGDSKDTASDDEAENAANQESAPEQQQQQEQQEQQEESQQQKDTETETASDQQQQQQEQPPSEESEKPAQQPEGEAAPASDDTVADKAKQETTQETASSTTASRKRKVQPKPVKKLLRLQTEIVGQQSLPSESLTTITARLDAVRESERKRRQLEAAKNDLESLVYSISARLEEDEELRAHTSQEQRDELLAKSNEVSAWLFESGEAEGLTDAAPFTEKHRAIHALLDGITYRISERQKRPAALESIRKSITSARNFVDVLLKMNETDRAQSEDDIETFQSQINTTSQWLETKLAAQVKLAAHEDPAVSSYEISLKQQRLDQLLKSMTLKTKPKKESTKPKSSSSSKKAPKKVLEDDFVVDIDDLPEASEQQQQQQPEDHQEQQEQQEQQESQQPEQENDAPEQAQDQREEHQETHEL
ncbi:hypoxia up-regulated protein [Capsaspora owczarzaki ATCC 30864]|uniref:Hypoxia up-regulated protein n=1 Tax=Capsaspora owczarzaki (strain ATCC 30864) TaxID=595528 RepID=A0A0D2X3Z4_CAPO3|nr:hypoxia up-regulated protein [Capsaspora owczarzaki ATCC 30864]KJE95164.1 hypoxia up-regulated protein [Capsaspora owczarzaki ATCC 30864]|eukprot:XP_004346317.1 hypoxia up-regulated protein [Capsaspora owczarzaki ATCC 30864]